MQKFMGIIIGVIFIAVGAFMYFKNNNLIKNCTVETEAVVVDYKEELETDSDSSTYIYYPVIEYTVGEKTITATMDKGSSTLDYKFNDKIAILYNPKKTDEFIVKGDKSPVIFSIVFMALGLIVTIFGIKQAIKSN